LHGLISFQLVIIGLAPRALSTYQACQECGQLRFKEHTWSQLAKFN